MNGFWTPERVAEHLGVTAKTVRDWLRTGDLIGIKVGKSWRIHPDDLKRLLDEQLFKARLQRAARIHPNFQWTRGQCRECGILMPEPMPPQNWVCSPECRNEYNLKLSRVLEHGSEEFALNMASVVPPY